MKKKNKTLNTLSNVFVAIFAIIAIVFFAFTVTTRINASKTGDSNPSINFFGYETRLVLTNSMEECDATKDQIQEYDIKSINKNCAIFIKDVPEDEAEKQIFYSDIKVGDVLTFKYVMAGKQIVITHRVTEIEVYEESYFKISLQGDNRNSEDGVLTQTIYTKPGVNDYNYIIGKVVGTSQVIGVIMAVAKSKVGIVCTIIVPCLIIIVYEIVNLVSYFGKEKKDAAIALEKSKDDEIERLKNLLKEKDEQIASKERNKDK